MTTSPLFPLERAVLAEIAKQHPMLAPQLTTAMAANRENTGAGFFTELAIDEHAPRTDAPPASGEVWAEISGFRDPMTFLLFVREGRATTLEGASITDDTRGVDFASVGWTILDRAPPRN
jgi:hypothetical protein